MAAPKGTDSALTNTEEPRDYDARRRFSIPAVALLAGHPGLSFQRSSAKGDGLP